MPTRPKFPLGARLAFALGGLATLILVGALLWAGFTAPLSSRMPVPSPDGRYFAYFNREGPADGTEAAAYSLIISSPDGKLLGRIATSPGRIIWSNANHLVALDQAGGQATIIANADNRFVQLTRLELRPNANPQWSSDGNKLGCLRQADTGLQLTIYDVQQPQMFPVSLPPTLRLNDARMVAWSPGGEQLYFLNAEGEATVLYGVDVHSGRHREMARGAHLLGDQLPQISPDGARIFWGPPENAVLDLETGASVWTLPKGARPLWRPWSRDSREFYFVRPEVPGGILGHNFSTASDQTVLSGVKGNGIFDQEGNDYLFREALPASSGVEGASSNIRRTSPGWMQAGRSSAPQALEGIEIWPWERTLDGLILARRDDASRVRYGLFDPETHRLEAYSFPTDGEDYLRQIKSYRLVIATVGLFTILAAGVFWKRSEAKSGRAFPILLFLAVALGSGLLVGNSVTTSNPIIPYRISLAEIGNQGWGISSSLPQVVFLQAQLIMFWLWALVPLAILNFAFSFPDRSQFLKSRGSLKVVLFGLAALPILITAFGRFTPEISGEFSHNVALISVATAALVWALSLAVGYQHPPDKSGRHAVLWFAAALSLLAAAYLGLLAVRHGIPGFLGGESPGALQLTFFVLAAWVSPSAMAYAVAARKPVGLGRFLRTFLLQTLMGVPTLAAFTFIWAVSGLLVRGSLWALSPIAILVAVLVAVLSILPFRGRLRLAIDRRFDRGRFESKERLADLARNLPHTVDRGALALQLEEVITKTVHARWCLLFVADRGSRKLAFQRGKTALASEMRQVTFTLDEPLCEYLKTKDPVFEPLLAPSSDEMEKVMASAGERLQKLRAEVVLGLRRAELLGVIVLGPKSTRDLYDAEELTSLVSVARETAAALENIDLFDMVARDREMKKELEVASDIQAKLFPSHFPKMTTGQLTGCCYPARTTGGDYYDFVELPGRKIGLIMCDVPGKGMPAALQAASLEKILGLQIPASPNLGELVQKVNRELIASSGDGKPSTLFYGVFDGSTRRLEYVSAGHPPPLVLSSQGSQFLESTGMPLGLFAEITHQSRSLILPAGAMLLIYSNGAIDARNVGGELFGKERLAGALFRDLASDAERALARVVAEIRDFEGDALLEDDQTFLLLKVYAE